MTDLEPKNNIAFKLDTLQQLRRKDVQRRQKQLLLQINSHKDRAKSEIQKFNGENGIIEPNE